MILNNAPQNEAVLSNVGEIGEFRIRNSAKAFNILSSGLYANKIRAIIRELSCNAVDSHVAAGKGEVPFEVHIPNSLEPHFSIRDFGTGLNHEQVTNIYTTYFESTKTDSNAFIGALGLGSKSPFSYTDNFTVTAIKDGRKGIYSAFINGEGVPSIALMMEEATDEPAGVEIKFSVNDRYDFSKFRDEAAAVYSYFKLQPIVHGHAGFKVIEREYDTRDLIPGVHVRQDRHGYGRGSSVAIMGNIAYPIDVPNPEQLGDLRHMLQCNLEMHFGIGELDFQASREGLSYIPQTVESIKKKLEAVNARLESYVKEEADKIDNLWERAEFLAKKAETALFATAVYNYAKANKIETYTGDRWQKTAVFEIPLTQLAGWNIDIRSFGRVRGNRSISNNKISTKHTRDANGNYVSHNTWNFSVDTKNHFVENDTSTGAGERAKYHYRETEPEVYSRDVYVLSKIDSGKDMNLKAFFAAIHNPPEKCKVKASSLMVKPRKDNTLKNVTILTLENRRRGYNTDQLVWVNGGHVNDFDNTKTFYYAPLSGYTMVTNKGITDVKDLHTYLKTSGLTAFKGINIYGVRKADLDEIKKRPNWVNIETFIESNLGVLDNNLIMNMVNRQIGGRDSYSIYNSDVVAKINPNSPFSKYVTKFKGVERTDHNEHALRVLYREYGKNANFSPEAVVGAIMDEYNEVKKRYPLLNFTISVPPYELAEYVNMIDSLKGI